MSEYFLIGYLNLKNFRLFLLQNTKKKKTKNNNLVIFFHSLEIEQIENFLTENPSFEVFIEKNINQTRNLILKTNVYVSYFGKNY